MRALIQRVSQAKVTVNNREKAAIHQGLLVFVGIEEADGEEDCKWLSNKIVNLRVFNDAQQVPNLSVLDLSGDILLVSQFTLQASTKKGNRPSYLKAAKAEKAIPLYKHFITCLETDLHQKISTGEFGADMKVELINDGPLTIWMDSKNRE